MEIRIAEELIIGKIYLIRGQKVMLDRDLAELYEVETRALKQQVRRNSSRFPADFMFVLSKEELSNLRSQIVISRWGGSRHPPMAFTEQGVAMLSSVLKSERAISVNIQIIRIFTQMRSILSSHGEIMSRLEEIENLLSNHDDQLLLVFEALKKLVVQKSEERPAKRIGYRRKGESD